MIRYFLNMQESRIQVGIVQIPQTPLVLQIECMETDLTTSFDKWIDLLTLELLSKQSNYNLVRS